MEFVKELFSVLIALAVLGVSVLATGGLCELVYYIKNKKRKKWSAWVFENYPELKVLLSEYRRLRTEYADTVREAVKWSKLIDECIEKNKYLPESRRIDKHIEALKEQYQELLDIRAEQNELVDKAWAELENFWKINFPNLREEKRIMWWSE